MKKKVLLGLAMMLACFIVGGAYIAVSIHGVTNNLGRIISFHKVEFLRQNLEHHIKAVQSDLLLRGSPHAREFDFSFSLIESMKESASTCQNCHHQEDTARQLDQLAQRMDDYMKLLSTTLTIRANQERLENARMVAFQYGENLLKDVKMLSVASAVKISERISDVHKDITGTKHLLITCIIVGPLALLLLTAMLLRRFTGSIDTLTDAAQNLESGDLDYRVKDSKLKDEFRTLAGAFNNMAESLQNEQTKFQSVYQLYQTLFETAGDAIMITGLDEDNLGVIVSANQAASELYGYPIEEILGMNMINLLPEKQRPSFPERARGVLSGEWTHRRAKRLRKDGSEITVDISKGLLQLGEQKYMLSFCRDITKELQAEEELQRANQMALVGQMAAGLAHEIKNPLAGVKVSLDVLSNELELPDEDKDLFARIISEINRMERLLKSLLNYARPPQPQFDLLDINQLLDSSLKNVMPAAASRSDADIRFEKEFSQELPRLEADSSQVQQVFMNILFNAVDAIDAKGIITLKTSPEGQDIVRIDISDTGKGMSEEALEKAFNPFFTTKTKGTGLGLSICRRLIEQHGGRIEASSKPGEGTTFVIRLPLEQSIQE